MIPTPVACEKHLYYTSSVLGVVRATNSDFGNKRFFQALRDETLKNILAVL